MSYNLREFLLKGTSQNQEVFLLFPQFNNNIIFQIYLTPDKTEISLSNYPRDATFVCLITYDNQHTALTRSCLNLTLNNSNATNSDTVLLVMMMLCLVGGVTFILIMKFKHMCKFSGVELKLPATRPSAGAERLT